MKPRCMKSIIDLQLGGFMACRGNRAKTFGSGQRLTGSDPQKKSDMYSEPQGGKNGSGSKSLDITGSGSKSP